MQQSIFDLRLTYCAPCGYTGRAIQLAQEILGQRSLEVYIRSFTLVPGSRGVFEFEVNGEMLFSKKSLGRHAEPGEIHGLFVQRVEREGLVILPTDAQS